MFYLSLIEQKTIRKRQVDNKFPNLELKLDVGNNKEYKIESIKYSALYARKAAGQLPGLYYLISRKSYPDKKDLCKPISAVLYL